MAGDYSRKRFNPENHYQGVLRQQGRVDLDADWNEYVDLQDRRWRAETIDVVGRCGVSSETPDGFKIQGTLTELTVGQGRIYVDGLLAENHGATPQFNPTLEENYGTAPISITPAGEVKQKVRSLVYLDVWRREVTYLQEPDLIEAAVNVDTTTRYQTAWQVKILSGIAPDVTCKTELADLKNWPPQNLPSAARLSASTVAVATTSDPCLVPPTGGYRGLENHLYRVEVHDLTVTGTPRVKWSRENAHVATHVLEIMNGGTTIRVESLGRDDVLRFENDDWVEIIRDSDELAGTPGVMRQVTVDDANQTLSIAALDPRVFPDGPVNAADHMRVIRWDQSGSALTADGLIEVTPTKPSFLLENGIEVTFNVVTGARSGDYWCFPARTADGDIDRLEQAPPLGIHHHFCKLAIIEADGTIHDCRPQFPGLTELTSLFYVSGDGQEAPPGQALPKPIQVGVANGKRPVAGANVRFRVSGGNGNLTGGAANGSDINILTDASGVASCVWTLDAANKSQQVEATLVNGSHLPVRFNAALSQPGGAEPGVHVQKIAVGGDPLRNDTEVTVTQLTKGITISCDDALFKGSVLNKPVCFVTLEMPFPLSTEDIQLWGDPVIGFQPLILAATVSSELESIFWLVTKQCEEWLGKLFDTLVKQKREITRLLARLTVKGNFIWSEKDPDRYLDGEVYGVAANGGAVTAIKLPSGDNRRGGDLEMWFWLIEKKAADVRVTIKPETAKVVVDKQVEFTVDVEGTTDKKVDVVLDPPRAGNIEQAPGRPNTWIYTAPTARIFDQVRVIATSSTASVPAVAVVTILDSQQEIEVTIAPAGATLEPGDSQEFTVTVKGGDVAKVAMSVNGVPNGNPEVGIVKLKSPGVWVYTAPARKQEVEIRATSQEDTSKFDTAKVIIGGINPPRLDAAPGTRRRRRRT